MRLEYYPLEKLKKEILDIISPRLDLKQYRVFFFGSRVMDKGNDRSDIDVGIEGATAIPAVAWLEIQEEFEQFPSLYKIEIVDFHRAAPIFREVALQNIEYISTP